MWGTFCQVSEKSQNSRYLYEARKMFQITKKTFKIITLTEIGLISIKAPTYNPLSAKWHKITVSGGFEMTCFIHVEVHRSSTRRQLFSDLTYANFGILASKINDKKNNYLAIFLWWLQENVYGMFLSFSPSISVLSSLRSCI